MDNIIRRIPGEIPPLPKESKQGFIDDLSKKEKFELIDLLERQSKLLSKKNIISKLPDKGKKIIDLKEKIEAELRKRDEIECTAKLLSRLNIATEGKAAMSELEWTGKYNPNEITQKIALLDSDDEEDPLKILAQPTGTGFHKKKIIHLAPEQSCIKPEDLEEFGKVGPAEPSHSNEVSEKVNLLEENQIKVQPNENSFDEKSTMQLAPGENSNETENLSTDFLEVKHFKYIVNKVENPENTQHREPFKPYKTTKSNVHDPAKEKQRGSQKELSAATPPAIIHNPAIVIDLKESLKLQQAQAAKLQEIQAKHAAERLIEKLGMFQLGNVPERLGTYRDKTEDTSCSSDDENYDEVHDDDDEDLQGTVTYSVDTVES